MRDMTNNEMFSGFYVVHKEIRDGHRHKGSMPKCHRNGVCYLLPIHVILQARTLDWVAISFSSASRRAGLMFPPIRMTLDGLLQSSQPGMSLF